MIYSFKGKLPQVNERAVVFPQAALLGEVTLAEGVSVWPGAVLRADLAPITVGDNSNLQDNVTVHVNPGKGVIIGSNVTVGHNAVLHGCTLENDVLIGMSAVILDGSHIGEGSIVGAGAVITGKIIPANSLVLGAPGKVVREITPQEREATRQNAVLYARLAAEYNLRAAGS